MTMYHNVLRLSTAMVRNARKERVLHTRIPAALDHEIKRVADALRVPVSNLVRQILEDSVEFVGSARAAVNQIQDEVGHDRAHLRERWARYRELFAQLGAVTRRHGSVYGWQPLIMSVRGSCAVCAVALDAGATAYVGVSDEPAKRVFRCEHCVPRGVAPKKEEDHEATEEPQGSAGGGA